MSLDSTYYPPAPAAAESGDDDLNKQQPAESYSSAASLTADTANTRQEQERGVNANGLGSGEARSSAAASILPFLLIDGITDADMGNRELKTRRSGVPAQANQAPDKDLLQLKNESRESVAEALDSKPGGGGERADNDDEPEAVKKYREKHKPSTPGKDVSPEPDPDKPAGPDDKKPDDKLKTRYETSEMEEAVQYAKDHNLPLVLHIGTEYCHWCKVMEKNSWPKIEKDKDVNDKAVYLHLDAEQVEKMTGKAGEIGKKLLEGVKSYPTIKAVDASTLETKESSAGYMAPDKLKQFIQRNMKD